MCDSLSKYGVVIVAGGSGQRMGGDVPKQFLPLGVEEEPVIVHSIRRFIAALPAGSPIVVVIPISEIERFLEIALAYGISERIKVCAGGRTRFESVRNGLAEITCRIVAVHDGVRPLVSTELIERAFAEAEKHGSAIPFVTPVDSFRVNCGGGVTQIYDRDLLMAVQTPQVFVYENIRTAYDKPCDTRFTDDAGVFEAAGFRVHMFGGERQNIKITMPLDMVVANALIEADNNLI